MGITISRGLNSLQSRKGAGCRPKDQVEDIGVRPSRGKNSKDQTDADFNQCSSSESSIFRPLKQPSSIDARSCRYLPLSKTNRQDYVNKIDGPNNLHKWKSKCALIDWKIEEVK